MNDDLLELEGHAKDLGGGFMVRRLLPAARRRSVGPFVFFDHFGPATERPEVDHDVRPHPHIGLATVTYLFEGAMMHRDSLGTEQLIEPGAINWMNAGRGIVHSERRTDHLKGREYVNHGLQLWVALPVAAEEGEPSFHHTASSAIPEVRSGPVQVRVLVGEALGERSPVVTSSPTLYLDLQWRDAGAFDLTAPAAEWAIYPVQGELRLDGKPLAPGVMAVPGPRAARLEAAAGARAVIVGGEALDGPRHMWWNFVSSRKERIVQAAADWEAQRMGTIAGETTFIPLPERRFAA